MHTIANHTVTYFFKVKKKRLNETRAGQDEVVRPTDSNYFVFKCEDAFSKQILFQVTCGVTTGMIYPRDCQGLR